MSPFWKQTLEAAGWTFLEAFLVAFAAGMSGVAQYDWKALGVLGGSAAFAGVAAAVSFLKSVLVRNIGTSESPLISG